MALLTNPSGTLVESYTYDPFGLPTIRNGSGTIIPTSAVGNRFLFTGREWDSETGLAYYRARYYKPSLGRFLSRDPLGSVDDSNLYTYVGNNPQTWVDPLGWSRRAGSATPNPMQTGILYSRGAGSGPTPDPRQTRRLYSGGVTKSQGPLQGMGQPLPWWMLVEDVLIPSAYAGEDLRQKRLDVGAGGGGGGGGGSLAGTPSGLQGASPTLESLYARGSIRGQSIVNIRSTLTSQGFRQTLAENKSGYWFRNAYGEEVRIMQRGGGWDIRVQNRHGNYLDEFGNVAGNVETHNTPVLSQ